MNYNIEKQGGLREGVEPMDIITRFEKLPTAIFRTEECGAQYVARRVAERIAAHNDQQRPFVLGLSTGRTPVGMYRKLLAMHREGKVSFANVAVFSLDEFYPIDPREQQSRNHRVREEFIDHIDIRPDNVHFPDGMLLIDDVARFCREYEAKIESYGSIDMMLLGMGPQGQLGFNEPGSFVNSRTRLVALGNSSRELAASAFFGFRNTPAKAITMGLRTILDAQQIVLMAWGEDKAQVVSQTVEGDVTSAVPSSYFQQHGNIEVVVDEGASELLTRVRTPWLVGTCDWKPRFVRKAVLWLCQRVGKPILKLTYQDYIENNLGQLLETVDSYDQVNIRVFNDLQHTITGWPGGKPNADDSTRPDTALPYPKRVLIFSPHPDDDVISMGGTFLRLVDQGHDVHVAYETSGNIAVHDDVVLQMVDTARESGFANRFEEYRRLIAEKGKGDAEPVELREIKGAIRRGEARAACRLFGLDPDTNCHFLNLPFYETGGIKKGLLTEADISIVVDLLRRLRPHRIFAAGDFSDPHGTHRISIEAVLQAIDVVRDDEWFDGCRMWLYRGAWQEWSLDMVDMAVPLSPDEVIKKRHSIYRHLSQKDIVPFPGNDKREFWQRAEERTQNTAMLYDKLGMAEYQAIEVFVRLF
ncbi:MAG: 6-phosphogluconolactonase [Rikenellaceae bacterium]|nr:6-phosphogluconolactonase [Rikenellaceae bacterium]MCL2693350.1 6-phosphogluconolactonase [Rikenellaceae bacterium]